MEAYEGTRYTGTRLLGTDFKRFYIEGSILHSFNFYVDLNELRIPGHGVGGGKSSFDKTGISAAVWNFPRSHQIIDVDIPTYKFQRESTSWGSTQFSYPVLSKEQPIDLRLTLEDNVYGNVGRWVNLLQNTVIEEGLHKTINSMKIGNIYVYLGDSLTNSVCCWIFRDVFYLGYENLSLSYTSNDSIKYTVTFGCDVVEYVSDNKYYGGGEEPKGMISRDKKLVNPFGTESLK